jgi:hypothetical protein
MEYPMHQSGPKFDKDGVLYVSTYAPQVGTFLACVMSEQAPKLSPEELIVMQEALLVAMTDNPTQEDVFAGVAEPADRTNADAFRRLMNVVFAYEVTRHRF